MIYYPFNANLQTLLIKKYKLSDSTANRMMSLTSFVALSSPLIGLLIDKVGKRPLF